MGTRTYKGERDGLDWYVEPEWCIHALLDAERFDGPILDPACGCGTIPKVCREHGYGILASDIVDRGFPGTVIADFIKKNPWRPVVPSIICNPPYRHAAEFVDWAIVLANKVAIIVPQQFPFSQRRHDLFTKNPLARLYFLSNRPSMPPGEALRDGTAEAKGGSVDYLWMVWEHGHIGPPTAHWLRK